MRGGAEVASEKQQKEKERGMREGLALAKGIWRMRIGKALYLVAGAATLPHLGCCN